MANTLPFILANRGGIPRLESTGVTVGTDNVKFQFNRHPFLLRQFNGLILFRLAQPIPTGTTATLPIVFDTNGIAKNVTKIGDTNVLVSDITGTGIYLGYYESQFDTLQLLTGV